jgi:ketosteroid isomerase-like protein
MNPATATDTAADPQVQAEAWVQGFIEGWRAPAGPDEFYAHFRSMLAPDVRLIQPQLPTTVGHEAFKRGFVDPLFALIPDIRVEVEDWAVRGDTLLIAIALVGTLGGRPLRWRAVDRVVLRDGLAIERESYFDPTPLLLAVATRPRAWPRFAAGQLRQIARRLRS